MIIYEDKPKYDLWGKIILSFAPSLMLLLVILIESGLLQTDSEEEAIIAKKVLLASLLAILILYWIILPRKYEIHDDVLKIVLGAFSYKIRLEDLAEVRSAEKWKALAYRGVRFTTSTKNIVEIRKKKGLSIVISPQNPEIFIENLNKAMRRSVM
ncbi:MAG: PH domain-containing protein [Archaeoglobaceae archaeon]|nr:PH domain-containing protein [Archaeoglobales archaeon]MDI9643556.1 PH domain-containing protein [Archaeoglobales archaeon]